MKKCTRLGIFQCSDKDGIVDDYIPYLLRDLRENLDRLVIIVNGRLTCDGRGRLTDTTAEVVARENRGFDAAAWKYAMTEYLGWDTVDRYDELVLLNDTFYGPFYPFQNIFEKMAECDVDFWGLTAHGACMSGIGVYFEKHLQSYFLVIRKEMHCSTVFKNYWEKQEIFQSFEELRARHEMVFTKFFEEQGFQWKAYIDMEDLDGEHAMDHYTWNVQELLKRGSPVLKRHPFQEALELTLVHHNGEDYSISMQYIRQHYSYDVSMIWQNILRLYNIGIIHDALALDHVIDCVHLTGEKKIQKCNVVVVLHLYYTDKLERCMPYIKAIPSWMDVIITTVSEKKSDEVKNAFAGILGERLKVLRMKNRGRDMAAMLVAAKPYILKYDYFCFCHDKMSVQMEYSVGKYFERVLWENTLSSTVYIENIIRRFEEDPCLGFLTVPAQVGGMTTSFPGQFWLNNYQNTVALLELLDVNVPTSESVAPLSIGTAFWSRTAALRKLFAYEWTYEDFPEEPMGLDGEISHALERSFPFVAQDAGYYTAVVMTPEYGEVLVNAYKYLAYHPKDDLQANYMCMTDSDMPEVGVKGALHLLKLTLKRYCKKQ